jgi:hypothetical protein
VIDYQVTTSEVRHVLHGLKKSELRLSMDEVKHYFLGFVQELRRMFTAGTPTELESGAMNSCCMRASEMMLSHRAQRGSCVATDEDAIRG